MQSPTDAFSILPTFSTGHRWIARHLALVVGVSLLGSLGCDLDEEALDSSEALESPDSDAITNPMTVELDQGQVRITIDGEDHPERIIASVEPDPDTKLYFIDESVDGEAVVDVVILGRDGGLDYGALLGRDKATPLELYLAFAEDDQPAPEPLRRAHDLQVERFRTSSELRDILKPGEAAATVQDLTWENLVSNSTCLSWSNYQSYMTARFSGESDRYQSVDSSSAWHEVSLGYESASEADMVVCNYESNGDPDYNDRVNGAVCWRTLGIPPVEDCVYSMLDDGHYLRRLYGSNNYRAYRAAAAGVNGATLQSFVGIAVNPE